MDPDSIEAVRYTPQKRIRRETVKNSTIIGLVIVIGLVITLAYAATDHIGGQKQSDRDVLQAELGDGKITGEVAIATDRAPQELYVYGVGRVMTDRGWVLIDKNAASSIKAGTRIPLVTRKAERGSRVWGFLEGTQPEWCRWNDLHQHDPEVCSGLKAGKTWERGQTH